MTTSSKQKSNTIKSSRHSVHYTTALLKAVNERPYRLLILRRPTMNWSLPGQRRTLSTRTESGSFLLRPVIISFRSPLKCSLGAYSFVRSLTFSNSDFRPLLRISAVSAGRRPLPLVFTSGTLQVTFFTLAVTPAISALYLIA